jgi:cyanophycin synthetase
VHALSCLFGSLAQLPHRRRTAVFSVAGDRRDDDFIRQGELLGEHFDRILIYEDEDCTRGRQPGETAALLRQGLARSHRIRDIHEIVGATHAAHVALEEIQPGELLLVQFDRLQETIALLRRYHAREIDFQEALRMGQPEPEPIPLRLPAGAAPVVTMA